MKIKVLVGVLVVLIVINLAAIGAFFYVQSRAPQPAPFPPPGIGEGPRAGEHMQMLGELDREERIRLFQTMRAFHEETRGLAEETRALEDRLIAAMNESPVPRARVDTLMQQIAANRLEIARRATDRIIAMGDSLSPAQRERIVNAIMRMRGPDGPGGPGRFEGRPGERARRWRGGR